MKTKFFRVAVEGATTDGRTIERSWLQDMAATYNRETYAARVNLEHVRGVTADGPFQAYGDVLGLKTEEITLDVAGQQASKLALFAELDVLDPLVEMNRKGQKLYTSVEVNPNFAGTGKAYLVGLAVTDSPASLGTEMLQFAAGQGDANPLAHRKQDPGNLFTAAEPAEIELEDAAAPNPADPTGIFASIKGLLDRFTATTPAPAPVPAPAADAAAETPAPALADFAALSAMLGQLTGAIETFVAETGQQVAALAADVAGLKTTVEQSPAPSFTQRPLATGGANEARTDC